jgi:glycosyltransferase involved in cell wall biosynthesis
MKKNSNDLVSVVVPIYQAEKYLVECIDSLFLQTYKDLEIILVNDGSQDRSGEIIDNYSKKDTRIKSIHKKNGGVSLAKNFGIEAATGTYITFIDADDSIREDFIENLVSDMKKYDVRIATTATDILPVEQDTLENVEICDRFEAYERIFYGTLEKSENGIQMLDRRLLVEHKVLFDPRKKIGEDFDFFVQALAHCDKIAVDYRKMYYYRSNPTSTMHQNVNEGLMKAVTNFSSIGEKLMKKYPELKKAVDAKKFSDSVSLAMRSYHVQEEWQEDFKELGYNIRGLKWQVLLDNKVRKKVRAAAFIYCVLGTHIGTILLRRIKK